MKYHDQAMEYAKDIKSVKQGKHSVFVWTGPWEKIDEVREFLWMSWYRSAPPVCIYNMNENAMCVDRHWLCSDPSEWQQRRERS